MASEEQINNQSRFNDLQRNSNELLADYQAGIRESSEFVSVLTTRSSQLVDTLKDVVKEKGKASQADKDLISSVTKINNLTKDFATPYTDAGKAIRDTNKATELHARLLKDVRVIGNKLGADRLVQANEYLKLEEQVYKNEQQLAAQRSSATSAQLKASEEIIEKDRNHIEVLRQKDNFNQKFIGTGQDLINFQEGLNVKVQAEAAAKDDLANKQNAYNAALGQQDIAQQALTEAEKVLNAAKASGNDNAIKAAEDELSAKQQIYNQNKRATEQAKQMVNVSRDSLSQAEDAYNEIEKGYKIRQEAVKAAEEERNIAREGADVGAKALADSQYRLDLQRDHLDESKNLLDAEQQLYLEGKKAVDNSRAGLDYLKEEKKRVREIVHAQTMWNLSLGAAEGILKKMGLDNQIITVGLDEGKKAAEEYAAELVKGRQEARGAAALAKQEEFAALEALKAAEQSLADAKANGSAASIQAAQDEYNERLKTANVATQNASEAEVASNKANSLTTKVVDSFKILGKGIGGTFKGMASELKALGLAGILIGTFKTAFKLIGGNVVTGFLGDLKNKFMSGFNYLKEQFFSLDSYIADAKAGDQLNQQLSQAAADLATNLGVSTKNAKELTQQAGKFAGSLGMMPEELAAATGELNKAFGSTQKFSDDTVKTFGQLTHLYGLTNEEASEFVKLSQLSGQEASDTTLTYKTQIQALKERNNVAISEKEIMAEIAKSSAAMQLTARGQGKSLAEAAFHAKKMGLSLKQAEGIGNSLLDFESSIANEMEAELLIGRDLNLERARSAALQGDLATVAKEVAGQIGSAAEFGKMNVIQQEALAKSVGVSRDELAEMLKTQELLAGTGFDDMNDAQAKFKQLLKETGSEEKALAKMKEMGASDALQDQMRQVSLQEKRAMQERAIAAAQAQLASAVNKLFDAFYKVEKIVKEIKATIVEQMKPFFDQFGGLVGDGGEAFKEKVLPYAKQLGKFLNDVGLRLTEIVKDHGPQIGRIFDGILKMFGSIYSVVGGVIKQLLGISDAGSAADGFFGGIESTINTIIEKLKNVDISVITDKVKGFIESVKNIFNFIFEKIGALGSFLGKNKGLTKTAGMGALALNFAPDTTKKIVGSTLKGLGGLIAPNLFGKRGQSKSAPMFVQDVSGRAGGGLMDMVGKMGGRQAGIGGGFKKGWKGLFDYAKMALKPGKAGQVGRARIARAAKGLVTGQGASFVGGTGKGAAQAAGQLGKLGGIAGKLGTVGKSLGKLAAGGGIGAVVGLAAEATLGVFQKKAEAAAGALDEQIAMTNDAGKAAELEAKRSKKIEAARNLQIAGTTAKYAGLGATIGSVIPGVGTAVGAAVGALAGFTVGIIDSEKARKRDESEAGKFAREMQLSAMKHQKSLAEFDVRSATMRANAAKKAADIEIAAKDNFAKQLAGANATFEDLQSMDIKHTDEAFKKLATEALNAGNITEKEYIAALKGSLDPLKVLELAASRSGERINELTNAAINAADAVGNTLKNQMLKAAGVNEDVVNAQLNAIQAISANAEIGAADLFGKYSGDLRRTFGDVEAVSALRGEDADASGLMADIAKQFKDSGASDEQVKLAMEMYANRLEAAGENFDLDEVGDITKFQQGIGDALQTVLKSDIVKAEAAASSAKASALTQIDDSGIIDQLASLSKEQLYGDEALQSLLSTIGVDMATIAEDGITGDEQKAIQEKLTVALTEGLMGVEGGNANLLKDLQTTLSGDEAARAELTKAIADGTYLKAADESAKTSATIEINPKSEKGLFANFKENFVENIDAVKTYFKDSFTGGFDIIKNIFKGNFSEAFEGIKKKFFALPTLLGKVIKSGASLMWKSFLGFIKLAVTVGPKIYDAIKNAAKKIKDTLISIFKKVTEKVKEFFQDPVGSIKRGFEAAVDFIKEKFFSIKDAIFEKFQSVGDWIKETISGALSDLGAALGIDDLGGKLKEGFEGMIGTAKDKFAAFKETIFSIFSGIGETIMGVIKGPLNTMIGLINKVIDSINSSLSFEIPGVSAFGKQLTDPISIKTTIPTIPMLAEGGIVEQATLAVIGEAGPEAVIPLDQIGKLAKNDFSTKLKPDEPNQALKFKIEVEPINLNNSITLPEAIDFGKLILLPDTINLNNFVFPPDTIDLNNFILYPSPVDLNNYIIYPEPINLGNYLTPPLPIVMDDYVFAPTPIELNNFILNPDIIDLNSYIEILNILLNSYIQVAEIDITPYITVDDINLNQYIDKLINLNDYIGEDIDLLGKLLPIDLAQIMKMNAAETASLQAQLAEANAQLGNRSLLEKGASAVAKGVRKLTGAEEVNDFILRPGQPALKFNKDDLVIGGTNLGGSNENSSQNNEKLEQELKELKQIMSGFVEQMSQVVNRPITVELNGNKVGQALGQDSYRIQ